VPEPFITAYAGQIIDVNYKMFKMKNVIFLVILLSLSAYVAVVLGWILPMFKFKYRSAQRTSLAAAVFLTNT